MRTMCSREIFTKKCRQQQNFDSDPKEAWHYNHVTFTPIAKNFMVCCRLIYMLSMLYVRLRIKVKVGIPESFRVGWYPHKRTGSSYLKVIPLFCTAHPLLCITLRHPRWRRFLPLAGKEQTRAAFAELKLLFTVIMPQIG